VSEKSFTLRLTLRAEGWSRTVELSPGAMVVVGRGTRADIVIDRKSVSHEHLSFQWTGEEVIIRDLGSSYGTFRMPQNSPFQEGNFPFKYPDLGLKLAKEEVVLSWEPLNQGQVDSTAFLERTRAERTRLEKTSVETPVEPAAPRESASTPPKAESAPSSPSKVPEETADRDEAGLSMLRRRGARVAGLSVVLVGLLLSLGLVALLWSPGFLGTALLGSQTGALKDLLILWSGLLRQYGAGGALALGALLLFLEAWARGAAGRRGDAWHAVLGRVVPLPSPLSAALTWFVCALILVWPYGWGALRGIPLSQTRAAFGFAREFLPEKDLRALEQDQLTDRINVLRSLRVAWKGSSLLYKELLDHQRARVLRECGGVGDRPWEAKKVCLVLLSAVAIETYGDIQPIWTAEIADRVALLLALDGVTRVISVEGVQSPFLPFFLDSLSTVGLDDEREDLTRLLRDPALKPALVRQILSELRRRIEVRLETRQRELRLTRAFRVQVPGPLESGI